MYNVIYLGTFWFTNVGFAAVYITERVNNFTCLRYRFIPLLFIHHKFSRPPPSPFKFSLNVLTLIF